MRCNVGVNPQILSDQHLIAEYRELLMVYGNLRMNDFRLKTKINDIFSLNSGHLNFFKNKFKYLNRRWDGLVSEMKNRNFQTNLTFPDYTHLESLFINDWVPSKEDSLIIRNRIKEKILMKPTWYRFNHKNLRNDDLENYFQNLFDSPIIF